VFDQAASYYDRTRTLSGPMRKRTTELLGAELRDRGPCLEIGVGTGRIALPLHGAGIAMAGVDLSPLMLGKLVEHAGGRAPFPLAVADATRLPFPDGQFGGGLVCHVLHLIPPWGEVLDELIRVIRPGGVVLVDPGGWGRGWWREVQERFCAEAGIPSAFPGLNHAEELDGAMADRRAGLRLLKPIDHRTHATIEERLGHLEQGLFSFTWGLDDETRTRAARATRRWAERTFGSLNERRRTGGTVQWRAYDLP
jgi:SAM-dependent methyltransferase